MGVLPQHKEVAKALSIATLWRRRTGRRGGMCASVCSSGRGAWGWGMQGPSSWAEAAGAWAGRAVAGQACRYMA